MQEVHWDGTKEALKLLQSSQEIEQIKKALERPEVSHVDIYEMESEIPIFEVRRKRKDDKWKNKRKRKIAKASRRKNRR